MKRLFSFALAAALIFTLAACKPSVTPPPETTPGTTAADDLILGLAGIPAAETVFTVDGAAITAEAYLYWLSYTASYYESYMQQYGQPIDWEEELDGQPLGSFLKSDAADTAKFYQLIAAKAIEYDCGLTDEQIAELATMRQESIDGQGGQDEYDFQLRRVGISEATLTSINETPYFYNNLLALFYGGDKAPTDADVSAYIDEQGTLAAKHILIRTVDDERNPLSEEEQADAKVRAEDLFAQIHAADDPVATFDDLMNQYSEDTGLASFPDGYTFAPGEMVPEFEEGTRALGIGEIADAIVQSDFGYHIIQRLPVAVDDELRAACTDELFRGLVDGWMAAATVEYAPVYETIDAKTVHEAMTAHREEMDAAHTPPETEPETPPETEPDPVG